MVLFVNATVKIKGLTTTVNDEGDTISSYTDICSFNADVQPAKLSEGDIALYGLNDKKAEIKKMFYNGYYACMTQGARAEVTSRLDKTTRIYTVEPVNTWPRHGECLLVPVENE